MGRSLGCVCLGSGRRSMTFIAQFECSHSGMQAWWSYSCCSCVDLLCIRLIDGASQDCGGCAFASPLDFLVRVGKLVCVGRMVVSSSSVFRCSVRSSFSE